MFNSIDQLLQEESEGESGDESESENENQEAGVECGKEGNGEGTPNDYLDARSNTPTGWGPDDTEQHSNILGFEINTPPDLDPDRHKSASVGSSNSDETDIGDISIQMSGLDLDQDDSPSNQYVPNTVDNPASSPPASPPSESLGDNPAEPKKPGQPIASCVPALEQLRLKKIALGEASAAPFADFLEFEFVKWMVERDISQGSRDKLIKLPLVS